MLSDVWPRAGAYVRLTKPRIVELLLVTTVPTMIVAAGGWPGAWRLVATVAGGALAAGSANALNSYLERDTDATMARTRGRPLPSGQVAPGAALVFAVAIGLAGTALLWVATTPLAAALAALAIVYYVAVYTLWLKPRTPHAVEIGGVAGSLPVLTGWAAVTADLADPAPWLLFAIVLAWQPPHFWALALRCRDDYAAARLPMLPTVRGAAPTARWSLAYAYVVAVAVAAYAASEGGALLAAASAALVGYWLWRAHAFARRPVTEATHLFRTSVTFLTLLFGAIGLQALT